jgi:hypothetical protein
MVTAGFGVEHGHPGAGEVGDPGEVDSQRMGSTAGAQAELALQGGRGAGVDGTGHDQLVVIAGEVQALLAGAGAGALGVAGRAGRQQVGGPGGPMGEFDGRALGLAVHVDEVAGQCGAAAARRVGGPGAPAAVVGDADDDLARPGQCAADGEVARAVG